MTKVNTVAIMQPTYLPWAGYFSLMQSVDLFIYLDSVQFSKRSWQQRNRIKTSQGECLLTVPALTKSKSHQKLNEVLIDPLSKEIALHLKSIDQNYRKSLFYQDIIEQLTPIYRAEEIKLCDLNINLIEVFKKLLNIKTPTIRASELKNLSGTKAELLSTICVNVGAKKYISPPGSSEYMGQSLDFKKNGIEVEYFHYIHPTYPQLYGDFISHLSIIDMLFNVGPIESKRLISSQISI